jgi:uroporphyrinogen-III synthase
MALESSISLLHRVSSIVSSDRSLDEMLGEIVGMTVQATECDACLVYLIDSEADEMVLRASQVPHARDLGELRIKMGEGVTGWVAEHRSVVALPSNAAADPRFKKFQALVEDTYEAYLSVPIVSGGESIGVINVHHREQHEHTGEEIATLIFIGEQMGGAVAKARLIEEAANVRQQLEDRKVVERAKGIIQQKFNTTEEDAYFRLRNQSRRLRRPMRELAEAIILAEDLEQ